MGIEGESGWGCECGVGVVERGLWALGKLGLGGKEGTPGGA